MNIFHAHYDFLKNEAEFLLKNARLGDQSSLDRIRRLEPFHTLSAHDDDALAGLQLKHILGLIASENGFPAWADLKTALDHAAETSLLAEITDQFYPKGFTTYWNIWFAKYSQAKKVLSEGKGFLLPYKHQFFIVEEHFVDSIGLPHTLPEWEEIGNDWVHPRNVKGWLRLNALYERVIKDR